jgi:hypothetical protein
VAGAIQKYIQLFRPLRNIPFIAVAFRNIPIMAFAIQKYIVLFKPLRNVPFMGVVIKKYI